MKNYYHQHTESNSYWDNSWTDEDWYLCESEEEYNEQRKIYEQKIANVEEQWKDRFSLSEEGKMHASEYYYGHSWQGKNFDCIGFVYHERLERSTRYIHIIKPNTITGEKKCVDNSVAWMYGS